MDNKDLIKQYVSTGVKIPSTQFAQLNRNLQTTYMRVRVMAVFGSEYGEFHNYEYRMLSDDDKKKYITKILNRYDDFPEEMFAVSSDDVIEHYVNTTIMVDDSISTYEYDKINNELKHKYMLHRVRRGKLLTSDQLSVTPDYIVFDYMRLRILAGRKLVSWEFDDIPDELKDLYIKQRIIDNKELESWEYQYASDELKKAYIESVKNRYLSQHQLDMTPDNLAMLYFKQRMSQGLELNVYEKDRYDEIINGQ